MSTHALAGSPGVVSALRAPAPARPARPAHDARRVAVAAFPGPTPSGGAVKGLGAAHQRKLGDSDLVVSCA